MPAESEPRVIAVDGPLLAVDKPAGWVVHAARPDETHDLRAWLHAGGHPGAEPVHRLDRDTSGVVLYSTDPEERAALGVLLASREVRKTYLALVHGRARRKGIVRAKLDGRDAVTRYTLHEALGGFSLLRVRPETGRKHQIRRHLHGLGLSIVGDPRYRPRRFRPVPGFPGRMFLHAWRLELPDGRRFEAPLPPDLEACLAATRTKNSYGGI